MRRCAVSLLLLVLLTSGSAARIWTDASGKHKIEAEYLDCTDNTVKLKFSRTGKVVLVPLDALSAEDRKYALDRADADKRVRAAESALTEQAFDQAIREKPANPEPYISRGLARLSRQDWDLAIEDFSKVLQLDPRNAQAYNGRGLAYQEKSELLRAYEDLSKAIELDPKSVPAYRNRGETLRLLALSRDLPSRDLEAAIEDWRSKWLSGRVPDCPWTRPKPSLEGINLAAALQQMAKVDLEYADRLERGGEGRLETSWRLKRVRHGLECYCPVCWGQICPRCDGEGCPFCRPAVPPPGLGVYPAKVAPGDTITLIASADKLAKGMPAETGPVAGTQANDQSRQRSVPITSVDFYRDVDRDSRFIAASDAYLGTDRDGVDGYRITVATTGLPAGEQSYFALPRGPEGSSTGASPGGLRRVAQRLEEVAKREDTLAKRCHTGSIYGLSADERQTLYDAQRTVPRATGAVAEEVDEARLRAGELLEHANRGMGIVEAHLSSPLGPGESSKPSARHAYGNACGAATYLRAAAFALREAAELLEASAANQPGQASAKAASGTAVRGWNTVIPAPARDGLP